MSAMKGSRRSLGGWMALVGLCAYAAFFYRAVLSGERVYVFRDLVTFFYSIEHLARLLASYDWPPAWNPFAVLGKPFAADPLAGVFYPPNWILRQLSVASGFGLSLALHHALAAAGMYLLARRLDLSLAAASLAALLFGFGGPLVSCDNVYNGLLAAAWTPWLVLAFLHWRGQPSMARLALVAVALALSLLGAMPEVTSFAVIVLLCLALETAGETRARRLAALLLAGVSAAGLSAALLLPSAEYVAQSSRAGGLNVANALQHSLPPAGLLSLLAPGADPSRWLLTLYLGPALLLAFVAPALLPRSRRWWVALPIVFLCLALGENLPGYAWTIEHVAELRVVRYPEKFLLAAHGLLAIAAGAGLEAVLRRFARRAVWIAVAVLGITAIDLWRANADLLPSATWGEIASPPASMRVMDFGDDPPRIYGNGAGIPDLPPYPQGLQLERELLLFQTANLFQIANLNAPSTINLVDHEVLEQLLERAPRERVVLLLGAFNTAYVTSARRLERPELTLVREPSTPLQAYVYRVEPLAPRVFVPRRVHLAAGPDAALASLREGGLPTNDVALEGSAPIDAEASITGTAELVRYQPSRVEIRAMMSTPGFVVLSDSFAGGWRATVDDAPAEILRANRFARAVAVAAGEHRLVFEYGPPNQRLGIAISLATALLLAVAAGISLRRARKAPLPQGEG